MLSPIDIGEHGAAHPPDWMSDAGQWGKHAVLTRDADIVAPGLGAPGHGDGHDDASDGQSVTMSDAGLDAGEDEWGDGAYLEWGGVEPDAPLDVDEVSEGNDDQSADDDESDDNVVVDDDGDGTEDAQAHADAAIRMTARSRAVAVAVTAPARKRCKAMPDYNAFDTPKLQRLAKSYGYRPGVPRAALVKIAQDCWAAIHGAPASASTADARAAKCSIRPPVRRAHSATTQSSDDVPLARVRTAKTAGAVEGAKAVDLDQDENGEDEDATPRPKSKARAKKTKAASANTDATAVVPLDTRFYELVMGDAELWLRVLRYEPISFDELVSKAIAAGIADRGWKLRLRRYLDLQSVTYYTEEPTGQRRRH
ncbi:hypothetical protein Q5752_000125 [Cryptotrichosporon argae]